MRRTRGGSWSYLWFGVPALTVVLSGYGLYVRGHHAQVAEAPTAGEGETALKPGDKLSAASHKGSRGPASFIEKFGSKLDHLSKSKADHAGAEGKAPTIPLGKSRGEDGEADEVVGASAGYAVTPGPASRSIAEMRAEASPAKHAVEHPQPRAEPEAFAETCDRSETRGESPETARVTKKDWTQVLDAFHASKHELEAWLKTQDFPKAAKESMVARIEDVKIQRPPAAEEPDLSWRGIGIFASTTEGPLVRVGAGFVRRIAGHSDLARFEMTRLVAQAWAPCELAKANQAGVWEPLLKCLNTPAETCAVGSNSEAGWAVSTSVAYAVRAPRCTIPAFADPKTAACLNSWKSLAHSGHHGGREVASEPWGGGGNP